jgi:outer membrane protein assembly factor BamB
MNDIDNFIFIGFNSRVAALHRDSGEIMWEWKSPKGTCSYVSVLLDGDRVVASVHGYTYCLDALTGEELWRNSFPGFGLGYPTLTSTRGTSGNGGPAYEIDASSSAAH